jgi:phosphopantothenate-cysteine ligase
MNVIITAGGTSELIDPVRTITNTATGRLGSLVAEQFAQSAAVGDIFYICSKTAFKPDYAKARIIPVTDTAELEAQVREVLKNNRIDAAIHSMAVSDYSVGAVTTSRLLAESLRGKLGLDTESLSAAILNADRLDNTEKLSSYERDLIVMMRPTPKIIALFKELSPQTRLVGFKLLDGVPHTELQDAAYELMRKNGCTFVLANDAREIEGDRHVGYLIDRDRRERRFETKQEIAAGIAKAILADL